MERTITAYITNPQRTELLSKTFEHTCTVLSTINSCDEQNVTTTIEFLSRITNTRKMLPLFNREFNKIYWSKMETIGFHLFDIAIKPLILR
jgi:hypothetical protein